jgi:tRNA (cytidine56-2'-O)-methyltransferase
VGLVARAFGAKEIIVTGKDDESIDSLRKVSENWGGEFAVSYSEGWRKAINAWRLRNESGLVVHLSMYGEPLDESIVLIREKLQSMSVKNGELLVIVGGAKVPGEIYSIADLNVAVGSQPHSEVAALAVFLDRLYRGKELNSTFSRAKVRLVRKKKRERLAT